MRLPEGFAPYSSPEGSAPCQPGELDEQTSIAAYSQKYLFESVPMLSQLQQIPLFTMLFA